MCTDNVLIEDFGNFKDIRESLRKVLPYSDSKPPTMIMVVGGDGAMLGAIRKYRHLSVPFFGINKGTRGFLLNDIDGSKIKEEISSSKIYSLWELRGEVTMMDGSKEVFIAFNDIWVERSTGQSLKMEVNINNKYKSPLIYGDGVLFSTPQGSTGYNRSANGKVIPLGRNIIQLTPMNALVDKSPIGSIIFDYEYEFYLSMDEKKKRPAKVYYDGNEVAGPIRSLNVRKSDLVVELMMISRNSFLEKTISWQFS